jgi:peptidoglycan-associated lipoprotein
VEVEGHADERGTNEYNLALGAKRADSVKRYLGDLGIVPGRLSTVSYGEELPLCKEQNEICWAKNRRARFVIRTAPAT